MLRRVEIGAVYDVVDLEELDAPKPWDVEQHAPTDHAVGHRHDRVGLRAVAPHVGRRPAAVHLAPHEHVRQRVDVRDAESVHVGSDVVAGGLVARDAVAVAGIAGREHVMVRGIRVLGRRTRREVASQADRVAGPHERGGRDAVLACVR